MLHSLLAEVLFLTHGRCLQTISLNKVEIQQWKAEAGICFLGTNAQTTLRKLTSLWTFPSEAVCEAPVKRADLCNASSAACAAVSETVQTFERVVRVCSVCPLYLFLMKEQQEQGWARTCYHQDESVDILVSTSTGHKTHPKSIK